MSNSLVRRLGLLDATVVGIVAMVGVGVFVAFAPATQRAGHLVWISLVVAAVLAICNALSSARLASRYPAAGGTYVYGRQKLGMAPGFLAGWGFVVGKTASCAAMALTFGVYVWPEHASVVAAGAVVVLTALNIWGVQRSATVARIIAAAVLASLALLAVVAFVRGSGGDEAYPQDLTAEIAGGPLGTVWAVLGGAGFLFFAFAGYARLATMGEEVRDPSRTLPRAIGLATVIVISFYAVLLAAALTVLGAGGIAGTEAPLLELAEVSGGTWLAALVRVMAAVAAIGALLAMILGVSRTTLAMARDRHLPAALGRIHPTTSSPYAAELAVGTVVVAIVLAADVRDAIGFSSFAVLVYYAVANAAALRLTPDEGRPPRVVPVVGLIGCLVVAASLPLSSVVAGLVVFAVGAVVFAVTRARATRPPEWPLGGEPEQAEPPARPAGTN